MPNIDDAPDRPGPILAAARIGELTRLALWLKQPGLTFDDVRRYAAERLERLYPVGYHIYGRGRCSRSWRGGRWRRSWPSGRRWRGCWGKRMGGWGS